MVVGNYYLEGDGFMLKVQVITPYCEVGYHLKEYFRKGPQNARELFNHRHSSLRNVIKRTFGDLKNDSQLSLVKQSLITLCTL